MGTEIKDYKIVFKIKEQIYTKVTNACLDCMSKNVKLALELLFGTDAEIISITEVKE